MKGFRFLGPPLHAALWLLCAMALGAAGSAGSASAPAPVVRPAPAPAPVPAWTLSPLFPPGLLHGVHGLAFDREGRLLAAETWGMAVHRFDPRTGADVVLVRGIDAASDDVAELGPSSGFAGTVVWSANFADRVMARDPDGRIRVLASGLPGINTIIPAPDGRLFATQAGGSNGTLLEIDPAGRKPPRIVLDPSGGLNGSFVTPEGLLFGAQQDENRSQVVRLDLATKQMQVVARGFTWPTGVKQGRDGLLYAVDLGTGRVHRIDPASGAVTTLARFEPGLDNLAIAPDGHVYVSHIATSSIYDIDPATAQVRPVVRGHFGVPSGLACVAGAGGDQLYVADLFTLKRVDVRSRTITTLVPLDRHSPFPTNVTARGSHLIASSLFGGVVAVFDRTSGAGLRRLAGFRQPHDAVELEDGRLLVAETGARMLTLVERDGARAALAGAEDDFRGLAFDPAGRLHAVATSSGTLYRVDVAQRRVEVVARGLGRPEGLAFDAAGRAWMLDGAARVLKTIDPDGVVREVARDLPVGLGAPPGSRPAQLFHGIAAGSCSGTYLASDRDATLYRLGSAAPAGRRAAAILTPPSSVRSPR